MGSFSRAECSCRILEKMRSELLLLALIGVVMCHAVSISESEVQPLGESMDSGAGAYAEVSGKKMKGLLQVPGVPKGHRIVHRINDVSETACKNACDADKKCDGYQYVAAEGLCKILKQPKKKVIKIPLKKVKKMIKKSVKKTKKAVKKKLKKKMKKKRPTPGQIYRETSAKLRARQSDFKKAKARAKEGAKKAKGAKAAEIITKKNEHREMMKELKAAKGAQEAGLNFEEQAIMGKTMQDKKVLIAKAHKVGAMASEEKQDQKFEQAKVVMKKGLKLTMKMKELKVKKIEKKVKMAKKARLYLKKQNKIAERNHKAVAAAKAGSKKAKLKKCRKEQTKMRKTKFKIKRRLKKAQMKKERKIANKKIKRLKKGLRKAEKRKAKANKKKLVKRAKHKVRMMFRMTFQQTEDLAESLESEEEMEDEEIKNLTAKMNKAKIKKDKDMVAAKFMAKREKNNAKKAVKIAKMLSKKTNIVA